MREITYETVGSSMDGGWCVGYARTWGETVRSKPEHAQNSTAHRGRHDAH